MKVMTFNLRFENDRDGADGWDSRKSMVVDLINRHSPDILGTQEGKPPQLIFLEEMLPQYIVYMSGRPKESVAQCPTLLIRKERFELISGKDVWLSETPDVYLSKSWDSAFPRMMSYCRMRDRNTGRRFYAGVTHLDHLGEEARVNQAGIIADWARQVEDPLIVMGDFNEQPGSKVHRILTKPETPLLDTWQTLQNQEGENAFTHHGFTGIPQRARMDWILAGPDFKVLDAIILRDQKNGKYPSDHFPYMVELEVQQGKSTGAQTI